MSRYFVKFVPYNEQTITHLVNKTVKFSTVFEFNDLNEYRYLSARKYNANEQLIQEFIKIIVKQSNAVSFNKKMLQLAMETRTPGYENVIEDFLKSGRSLSSLLQKRNKQVIKLLESLYQKHLSLQEDALRDFRNHLIWLYEDTVAYTMVGIFCMSDISVFEDDAAQLMFAHYAKNSSGLALIYQYNREPNQALKIQYENFLGTIGGKCDRLIDWSQNKFEAANMKKFLQKSPYWNYEKEYRIFDQPKIHPIQNVGLELKAILYTPRFDEKQNLQSLEKINEKFHQNSLAIRKIYASQYSCQPYHFKVHHKKAEPDEPVSEFLRKIS